jgi:outer membrane murein-binding lipoprotein Lpp
LLKLGAYCAAIACVGTLWAGVGSLVFATKGDLKDEVKDLHSKLDRIIEGMAEINADVAALRAKSEARRHAP